MLDPSQIAAFRDRGFVVAPSGLAPAAVAALRDEIAGWIEESRSQSANYGETVDGRKRFDLEPGHGPESPRLRRVANPVDISEAYRAALFDGPIVERVAQLIGPDVRFHHCKLNIKLPGMATRVDWHQDHAFDPHSNDDVVVMLLLLDDMTEANGALRIVPGSQHERHSHFEDGRFVGATARDKDAAFAARAEIITGRAGDACFMHTWCLHGSGPNSAAHPRRLLICDYAAADALPLGPPQMASAYSGRIVHGQATRRIRLKDDVIELPPNYDDDSFFSVQAQKTEEPLS